MDDDVGEKGNAGPAACEMSTADADEDEAKDRAAQLDEDDEGGAHGGDLGAGVAFALRLGTTTTCKSDHLRKAMVWSHGEQSRLRRALARL